MTKAAQELDPVPPSEPRWRLFLGVTALLVGLTIWLLGVVRVDGGGLDFPVLYEMGRGVVNGTDVYSTFDARYYFDKYGVTQYGMFYPPSTGIAILPLALLPYPVAMWSFAVLTLLAIVFGVRELFRIRPGAVPQSAWYFATGLVLASAAMRWGAMLLQLAPLVFGLLCLFIAGLHRGRPKLAVGIAMLVLCFKVTLALPFVGLLAIYRRFGAAFAMAGAWIAINAVGFWRFGSASFAGYRKNIAILEDISQISSPDPWRPVALPRLDWMSLCYGITRDLTVARVLSLILAVTCGLWLLREWLRNSKQPTPTNTALFLPALVCLNSCAVYHHQYDAVMFFAPVFVAWICLERRITPALVLCLPLLVMIVALPIGKVQDLLQQWLGLFGVGLLKLSFPVAFTLALLGSMLNLSSHALDKPA
jgi:hypothetical protein